MKLKRIFMVLLALVVVAFVVVGIVRSSHQKCTSVAITLSNKAPNPNFTEKTVEQILKNTGTYPLNKPLGKIDRDDIHKALRQNVWFDSITSLSRNGSKVELSVATRVPLVQVFPSSGNPYLISSNGDFLPIPPCVAYHLILVNGLVNTQYTVGANISNCKEAALVNAFQTALYISKHPTEKAQYSQIFINNNREIELYNNVSQHVVLIGNAERLPEKFENLQTVYSEALVYLPSKQYSRIDARFKDRIFATKKQNQ